jgi:hypothetical protein
MTPGIQVTFDAADPHALARFWSRALGYEVEVTHDLIEQLLAVGRIPPEEVVEVDGVNYFRDVVACSDPRGERPRLLFQRADTPKPAKNRLHLDLHVSDVDTEVARIEGLGARRLWESDDRGTRCITLADPEGNEFCVE